MDLIERSRNGDENAFAELYHRYKNLVYKTSYLMLDDPAEVEDRPDYEYADGVTYHVFALDEGATATAQVPALDGSIETTVEVHREGDRTDVQVQGVPKPWSVLLRGVSDGTSAGVSSAEGGAAQAEALGTRLVPAEDVRRLVVHL